MLKFTKQSVIAFDFREALSFEGETGPYVQYAVVRATNIFRKAGVAPEDALKAGLAADAFVGNDDLWSLWLAAGQTAKVIEQCIATTEPAALTKHAFQLAQQFNNFYHKHHILDGRRRDAEGSAAGDGGGGASRVDGDDGGDGDSGSGSDVR